MIRKVKILKKPKFDLTRLMELYKVDESAAATTAQTGNVLAAEEEVVA
jgi:hypothetical protein